MPRARTHELRCFCNRKPLLAMYGINEKGKVFLHQKTYKGKQFYSESIVYSGEVLLHCRICLRWHRVIFIPEGAEMKEDSPPVELVG